MVMPMQPLPKELRTALVETEYGRAVVIPDDFVIEGGEIILRQERDGLITISPGSPYGREAMWRAFDPFKDDDGGAVTRAR
jgi:hypothetical protein